MANIHDSEKMHLRKIIAQIKLKLKEVKSRISKKGEEIHQEKCSLWQNIYEMDPVEIISQYQEIDRTITEGEDVVRQFSILNKQVKNPYFAKITFRYEEDECIEDIYIGIGSFFDEEKEEILVFDWRAPISSMFYDFEIGKAYYTAPVGKIFGEILGKRQFKIVDSKIEYMLDSNININDEILQKCLAQNSVGQMHNIIATIQREQNAVIRNDNDRVVILQGVAGSGKTSIALHRVAYLLYKYRKDIKSENILIISPNSVFANYISGVLPELGEENILECEMIQILENEISSKYKIETASRHLERILEDDKDYIFRTKIKSTYAFQVALKEFVEMKIKTFFEPNSLNFETFHVDKEFLMDRYCAHNDLPPLKRIERIVEDIKYKVELEGLIVNKQQLRKVIKSMFTTMTCFGIYKDFVRQYTGEAMFTMHKNEIEYIDAFAITYIKVRLEGGREFKNVRHLIIDEMQDYPPICYELVKELFNCKKTILGDISQSLNGISTSNAEDILKVFPEGIVIKLNKSYRSTFEIIDFARKILSVENLIPFERHGEKPTLKKTDNVVETIKESIIQFRKTEFKSMAIICKTEAEARNLYEQLKNEKVELLSADGIYKEDTVIITTVQVSKGLEFDFVLVPNVDFENYSKETERNMLYVACTRAMHKLELVYTNKITEFLEY